MTDEIDFEAPGATEPVVSVLERLAWVAILLACTAPFQVLLDQEGRPGSFILTSVAAIAAAAIMLLQSRGAAAFRLAVAAWPYLLVMALMGAFTLGAVDAHWSSVRWLTWLPCPIVAFCFSARCGRASFVAVILATLAAALLLSVTTAVFAPSYGVMGSAGVVSEDGAAGAWSGIYRTKNVLGHTAGIGVALLIVFGRRAIGWLPTIAGGIAAATCLIMARSASGIAIAVLLTGFCLFVLKGSGFARIGALAGTVAAGLALVVSGETITAAAAGLLGRDATLSGRTAIWREAWPYALQQPAIGSGYDYTGSPDFVARMRGLFDVYSVHSGYLDALITLGFGLCALLALTIALVLQQAWTGPVSGADDRRGAATALLLGGLMSAVTEAGVTHPSGPMQMLWLLGLFGLYACAVDRRHSLG